MLRTQCPQCREFFHVPESMLGTVVACDRCGQQVRLPDAPAPASTEEAGTGSRPVEGMAAHAPEPPPRPRPPLPRFDVAVYRPDGGFNPLGAGLLIGLVLAAGVGLGYVTSLINQWFYLIILFPCGIGLLLGLTGAAAISLGKVRNPLLAGVAGFLGGCVAMVSVQYFDYLRFQRTLAEIDPALRQMLAANPAVQPPAGLTVEQREGFLWLRDAAQVASFPQYLDFQARQGVTISRAGHGHKDRGLNLGYVGSYVYWGVELLIVAVVAFFIMSAAAGAPFCRECQAWKKVRQLGGLQPPAEAAAGALRAGDLAPLADQQPGPGRGPLTVSVAACPLCQAEGTVDVKLERITKGSKGEDKKEEVAHVTYPGEALPFLEALFRDDPPGPVGA